MLMYIYLSIRTPRTYVKNCLEKEARTKDHHNPLNTKAPGDVQYEKHGKCNIIKLSSGF